MVSTDSIKFYTVLEIWKGAGHQSSVGSPKQCSGSGSRSVEPVSFWTSRIRNRIRILIAGIWTDPDVDPAPDPSITKQKHLEKPWFQLFCDFLMTSFKNLFFVGILKT